MSLANDFKDKTVIVTGGGRGIGKGICIELAKLGAKVYAVSRTVENLKALQEEYPTIQIVAVDLGDWDATREAFEKIETVDMLVNNAGVAIPETFLEATQQNFDTLISVNLKAVINVSQIVAKKMIADNRPGSIVNISSLVGMLPMPLVSSYSTVKAGLDHLTKIMSIELGPHNIRVNSVNPGPVQTEMQQQFLNSGRLTEGQKKHFEAIKVRVPLPQKSSNVDNIVKPVVFLLSNSASMITGTILPVEGGYYVA